MASFFFTIYSEAAMVTPEERVIFLPMKGIFKKEDWTKEKNTN